jgi:hypothetical protein
MNVTDVKGEKAMDAVNRNKVLPLNKTYIGPAAMETMQSIIEEIGAESTDVKAVFEQCHNFITETTAQMQKRFEGLEQFDFLSLLKSNNAISLEPASLVGMYKKFPYLKIDAPIEDVDREWREHVCLDGLDGSMNEGEYWHEVFSAKLPNGGPKYSNLRKVISIFFSFPFANGPVERIFSQLSLVKSEARNSLKEQSLVSLMNTKLYTQQMEKKNPGHCQAALYRPDREILKLYRKMIASADDELAKTLKDEFIKAL